MNKKKIPLHDVDKISDLRQMLFNSQKKFGPLPAFLRKNNPSEAYHEISYNKFTEDVVAFGSELLNMGFLGKRIAIIGENRYEWSVSYLAAINGLSVVVPLDKELPANEITTSLNRAEASVIIFSGKLKDKVLESAPNVPTLEKLIIMDDVEPEAQFTTFWRVLEEGRALSDAKKNEYNTLPIDVNAMNVLLFTSGTTDIAKAVMLSQKNICENLMAMSSMVYIDEKDVFLSVLPIHHTYECTCGYLCPLYRGSTIAYCDGLRHITKNLAEAHVTIMLGVPLIFESMHKKVWEGIRKTGNTSKIKFALKLSAFLRFFGIDRRRKLFKKIIDNFGGSMRMFIAGAAGINPVVSKDFNAFGILTIQGYGLTECAPIAALNRNVWYKDSSAGLVMPGCDIKIVDKDEDNIGEILIKGPNVMLGYYNNQEATSAVMTEDGYFRSGDYGYLDKDNFLYITGRKKNVIVTKNGKNIFPEEIEELLLKSDYISEVVVYGSEENGETVVKAQVFPNYDRIRDDAKAGILTSDNPEAIVQNEIKAVNKQLVSYKAVHGFTLRETEFEKTSTKKIKRYAEANKVK